MKLSAPQMMAADHGIVLGAWRQFFFIVYTGATSAASIELLDEAYARFREQSPGSSGLCTVVEEQAPLPPGPVREGIARFMKAAGGHVVASALVQEGTGFRAAAVRSVATGITLLAKQPFPHHVFATVAEASRWLVPSFEGVSEEELSANVAEIRRMAKAPA